MPGSWFWTHNPGMEGHAMMKHCHTQGIALVIAAYSAS